MKHHLLRPEKVPVKAQYPAVNSGTAIVMRVCEAIRFKGECLKGAKSRAKGRMRRISQQQRLNKLVKSALFFCIGGACTPGMTGTSNMIENDRKLKAVDARTMDEHVGIRLVLYVAA